MYIDHTVASERELKLLLRSNKVYSIQYDIQGIHLQIMSNFYFVECSFLLTFIPHTLPICHTHSLQRGAIMYLFFLHFILLSNIHTDQPY